MNSKKLAAVIFAVLIIILAILVYLKSNPQNSDSSVPPVESPSIAPSSEVVPAESPAPVPSIEPTATQQPEGTPTVDFTTDANGLSKTQVVIETNKGIIKYKFYSNDAPNTSKRIAELVQQGFYNGLTFHRVEPGFVIQGGDPNGNGTGGSGQKLKAEFNSRKHVEGTVAMARSQNPDSADSQFYICLGSPSFLDGQYTVFGQLTEGMDVVRQIRPGDTMKVVRIE